MNEIAGTGNWNTAEFWEYQTRTGHRENTDPKPNHSLSPYAVFGANPILNSDINGDVFDIATNDLTQKDIKSMIIKDNNKDYLKISEEGHVSLDFGNKSETEISKILSEEEGLSLINDLVKSDKKYLYEASDFALFRDENYSKISQPLNRIKTKMINASNFGKDSKGGHEQRPKEGYDGQVVIHPAFMMYEYNLNGTVIAKPRVSVVFHELEENYERTNFGIDYQGKNGAHRGAINREMKWGKRSNDPGEGVDIAPLPSPTPERMKEIMRQSMEYYGFPNNK